MRSRIGESGLAIRNIKLRSPEKYASAAPGFSLSPYLEGTPMHPIQFHSFETTEQLENWLQTNHATQTELWVRIFKKGSATQTVTWNDCVVAAIAWGWIDGQRKSLDDLSFLQRLTPRSLKSNWSKRNTEHAERLIAEGRMQAGGLAHVQAAREDGRWDQAYSGSAEMVIPDDFLKELEKNPAAKPFFAALDRKNLYAIYYRIQTAKRPETRKKRIAEIVTQLAQGKKFH